MINQAKLWPLFTRCDHGQETPLWVSVQASLAEADQTEVLYKDKARETHIYRQGNLIQSCHIYGPSTANIRIESWWRHLRHRASDRWIVSFFVRSYFLLLTDSRVLPMN